MKTSLFCALATIAALLPLASASQAQDKPALTSRLPVVAGIDKQTRLKLDRVYQANAQKIQLAFRGEEALKAAMSADFEAIRAEKNPQTRKALQTAFRAKYEKDARRIFARSGIDLQSVARDLQSANPDTVFSVEGLRIVGRTFTPQSQPAPAPAPAPQGTVRELTTTDFTILRESDCGSGYGETTQSGGYMTSTSEGCVSTGVMTHILVVPAGTTARVEMRANLSTVASAYLSYAMGGVRLHIEQTQGGLLWKQVQAKSYVYGVFGDDDSEDLDGASIVTDLSPGTYKLEAMTDADASPMPFGFTSATARLKQLRVKITLFPQ